MNYSDVLANARECIGKYCKACPVCNGVACKNQIPGPGAKGVGDTAIRNYNKWAEIRVNMDTLCEGGTPDTHIELFGKNLPVATGLIEHINVVAVFKDVLDLAGRKQVFDVLRDTGRNAAPLSKTLPYLNTVRCRLLLF